MIKQINSPREMEAWQERDIFSIRILSLLNSYGCRYQFATFYLQENEGEITAALSKLDGDVTLALREGADTQELLHFFCVTGYHTILCSDAFVFGAKYEEGSVMSCTTKWEPVQTDAVVDEYPKLMDLFNFTDYNTQDFQSWYVDISHRVRHGTAKAYTLCNDNGIIASGILSSIVGDDAILSAVRCTDAQRRKGYGSALVKHICNDVCGTVCIMREKGTNEAFYQRLGFKENGNWRLYK